MKVYSVIMLMLKKHKSLADILLYCPLQFLQYLVIEQKTAYKICTKYSWSMAYAW